MNDDLITDYDIFITCELLCVFHYVSIAMDVVAVVIF